MQSGTRQNNASAACLQWMKTGAARHPTGGRTGGERWLQNPLIVLLNLITLLFVVFHAITWFNVAPRAMAIRLRGRRVPDLWIVGTNYVTWAAISLVVVWLLVRS